MALLLGVLALAPFGVAADEPAHQEEQPKERAQEQEAGEAEPVKPAANAETLKDSRPVVSGNSLAAAASRIRLNRPAGEGVVISNDNLDDVAAEGTVSVAGGVASTPPATAAAPQEPGQPAAPGGEAGNPANALVAQYQEQQRTVKGLEERLANFDSQIAEAPEDPHYPQSQSSPQNRAPGVQDRAQMQREALAKELDQARKALDQIRRRARREGVELR
jgi:hypothetical protein